MCSPLVEKESIEDHHHDKDAAFQDARTSLSMMMRYILFCA